MTAIPSPDPTTGLVSWSDICDLLASYFAVNHPALKPETARPKTSTHLSVQAGEWFELHSGILTQEDAAHPMDSPNFAALNPELPTDLLLDNQTYAQLLSKFPNPRHNSVLPDTGLESCVTSYLKLMFTSLFPIARLVYLTTHPTHEAFLRISNIDLTNVKARAHKNMEIDMIYKCGLLDRTLTHGFEMKNAKLLLLAKKVDERLATDGYVDIKVATATDEIKLLHQARKFTSRFQPS